MGYHIYPQEPGSPSARSDTDLWNHINRWVWGKSGAESSPRGTWGAGESSAIVPTLERYGQVHQDFHSKLESLGTVAQGAKAHRDEIERKLASHGHNGLAGFFGNFGFLISTTNPFIPGLGASGAVYGVLGALAVLTPFLTIYIYDFF